MVNIAIGEMLMAGAYLFFTFPCDDGAADLAGHPAAAGHRLLGAVIERTMIRPLLGEPPISGSWSPWAWASVLVGVVEMIWSADQRRLPDFLLSELIMVGDAFLAPKVFWGAVIAVCSLPPCCCVPLLAWRRGAARHGRRPGGGLFGRHQRAARVLAGSWWWRPP